jgi:hypothetical protein
MMTRRPGSTPYVPAWDVGRSRISWGAVLAGAATAVATSLLLSLLGAALGAGWVQPFSIWSDLARLGTGAVLWGILNLSLSMLLGGYVAARLSGTHSHQDAELHGLTTWAVATLIGVALAAWLIGGLAGILGQGIGSLVNRSDFDAATRLIAPEANVRATAERLRQSLGSGGDITRMNREQMGAEIASLTQGSLMRDLSGEDRERLTALVAAEAGIVRQEAARRVARLEADAKAARDEVVEKARAAADTVAQGAATAARALFTALTTGLLASLIGAWFGTRHKRSLHPAEVEGYAAPASAAASASGTRSTFRERTQSGAASYDDDGRHITQVLRSATFPVSKQELLRIARSRTARPSVLDAIESIPDGTYADINEVLDALDMAHA